MSFTVAERTHEIGVRMAVGAGAHDVLWLVMRRGVILTGSALCVGGVLSMGLARLLSHLVFGVSAYDPLSFGLGIGTLTAAALLACFLPARRALALDPMQTLRAE